jgi:surface antigen
MVKKILLWSLVMISSTLSIIAQPVLRPLSVSITPQEYHIIPTKKKIEIWSQTISEPIGTILSSSKIRSRGVAWFQAWTCTDYAASKKLHLFIHNGKRLITGNAKEWLRNAKNRWTPTGAIPRTWSIAVFAPWKWAGRYGHVAYVEQVDDNGKIIVTDMNYRWRNVVTKRVVSARQAIGYIY